MPAAAVPLLHSIGSIRKTHTTVEGLLELPGAWCNHSFCRCCLRVQSSAAAVLSVPLPLPLNGTQRGSACTTDAIWPLHTTVQQSRPLPAPAECRQPWASAMMTRVLNALAASSAQGAAPSAPSTRNSRALLIPQVQGRTIVRQERRVNAIPGYCHQRLCCWPSTAGQGSASPLRLSLTQCIH